MPSAAHAIAAMALLVAASYFPALQGGFVWDDVIFSEEPVIHLAVRPAQQSGCLPPTSRTRAITGRWCTPPSGWSTKLWGLNPVGYHAVNILLHLVNCLLLWRLLDRLAIPGAIVIAAVFAVHPMHVESVAWIIERKDVLSALFYLTAVLVWIRFDESPGPGRYALALALFAAGLLAKSVVVTLPVALLIWHWWQRGRITAVDLLRLAPFVMVGLAITLADLTFYTSREPLELGYSLVERGLIAARALWFYAGKLVWPADLAVIYPLWKIDTGDLFAWVYLAGAVAVAALLWFGRRRFGTGTAGGGAVVRGDAGAGAGVRGLRLHAVLVGRRPFPVPGRDRRAGGTDRGRGVPAWASCRRRTGSARARRRRRWCCCSAAWPGGRQPSTATRSRCSATSSRSTRRHAMPTSTSATG